MFNRQSIVLDRRGSMNRSVLFHQAIDVGHDRNRSKMSTLPHEDSFVPIYTKRRDREFHLLIQALQQSSRAARRLPFEMDQDAFRVISSRIRLPITLAPLSSGRSLKSSRRSWVITSRSSASRFDSSWAWNFAMSHPSEM